MQELVEHVVVSLVATPVLGQRLEVYHMKGGLVAGCALHPRAQRLHQRNLRQAITGSKKVLTCVSSDGSPSLRGPTTPLCGTNFTPSGFDRTDWGSKT